MGWFEWVVFIQISGGLIFLYFIVRSLNEDRPLNRKWEYQYYQIPLLQISPVNLDIPRNLRGPSDLGGRAHDPMQRFLWSEGNLPHE